MSARDLAAQAWGITVTAMFMWAFGVAEILRLRQEKGDLESIQEPTRRAGDVTNYSRQSGSELSLYWIGSRSLLGMDVNVDLTNGPDGHRGRQAAQAAITAQWNGDTEEANRILGQTLNESINQGRYGLISGYCNFTTTVVSALVRLLAEDHELDGTDVLQRVFLQIEADRLDGTL